MLKSMTGFGKCTASLPGKTITIEIKSLNSKQLDLNIKLPPVFREKEPDIRNMISKNLERGKIELTGTVDYTDNELPSIVNSSLVKGYYKDLKQLSDELGAENVDLFSIIMKIPDVLKPSKDVLTEEEWVPARQCIENAIQQLDEFRQHEGAHLSEDFMSRIITIKSLQNDLGQFEEERNHNFREKLRISVEEFTANNSLDANRFEQEIIYYLEKLDITEEKVRLQKHLDYFMNTLGEPESAGRKLSFVTQEIGREINTIGSKANDANIQRIVVQMKDELEKIKEQLANIL